MGVVGGGGVGVVRACVCVARGRVRIGILQAQATLFDRLAATHAVSQLVENTDQFCQFRWSRVERTAHPDAVRPIALVLRGVCVVGTHTHTHTERER